VRRCRALLELKMTLTDRKYYAKPWTSETKRMHLLPKTFVQSGELLPNPAQLIASGWTRKR